MAASGLGGRRRDIAMLLSEKPRTLRETAQAMGKPSGDIYRAVHRMVDEGILEADSDPPVRGTQFWLNPHWRAQLDEALPEDGSPGLLVSDQRILVVESESRTALYGVLARKSLSGCVAWFAELDGSSRYLVVLQRDASMLQANRLEMALEAERVSVTPGRVGTLLAGSEVRRAAEAVNDFVRAPA